MGSTHSAPAENELYAIAEQQAGYFTTAQARSAGFSYPLINHHTKSGRFLRVRRGIYRLARFPGSPHEDLVVAWLRAGLGSAISHESALSLHELGDVLPAEVHVIVPRTASRRREGIRQHTNRLRPDEITRRFGVPVTTTARTIADAIAGGMPVEQAARLAREALQRGLTTEDALAEQATRRGGAVARALRGESFS